MVSRNQNYQLPWKRLSQADPTCVNFITATNNVTQ